MLEHISWKEFLIAVGSGCAAYYGILAVAGKIRIAGQRTAGTQVLPGRPEQERITHPGAPPSGTTPEPEGLSEETEDTGNADDREFSALELLADELQVIITQYSVAPSGKEALIGQLRQEIARYPTLNQPAFQRAINNLIINATRQECELTITEEEVRECWPEN